VTTFRALKQYAEAASETAIRVNGLGAAWLVRRISPLFLTEADMTDDRTVTIKNTGKASIRVVLNYHEGGGPTIDLMPGNEIEASIDESGRVVVNDVGSMAVFGQQLPLRIDIGPGG